MDDTRLTVELDKKTKRDFKAKACYEGKTLKEKIIELINEYLTK
jgi:hypothetical protein